MTFRLHDRLAADTAEFDRWELSRVLLMNDAAYPWLIVVPERDDVREIHQLSRADAAVLMEEVTRASRILEAAFRPDKINVGALGNVVPQLHVHVVARFASDPAWPGPVWGAAPPTPYGPEGMEAMQARLRDAAAGIG